MGHRLLLAAIAASLCSEATRTEKKLRQALLPCAEAVNSSLPDPSWIVPFDGDLIGIANRHFEGNSDRNSGHAAA